MKRNYRGPMSGLKKQKGLTMIELSIGIVILLGVVALALIGYQQVTAGKNTYAGQGGALGIVTAYAAVKTSASCTGVTATTILDSKKAPANLINAAGTGLQNEFGGAITLDCEDLGTGVDNALTQAWTMVPDSECNSLVASLAKSFPKIEVGTGTGAAVKDSSVTPAVEPTPTTIAARCGTSNTIKFWSAG